MALIASFFEGKPNVPAFVPVNAQQVQSQTVTGNSGVIPETIAQTNAIQVPLSRRVPSRWRKRREGFTRACATVRLATSRTC